MDDYDDTLDNFNTISNIINYVERRMNKFLLCILGECSYAYRQFYNYILNNSHDYTLSY